jgi:hypothetical protein
MSNEPYQEVTTQSWGGRLKESIKGVAIGFLLIIVAFPVLWFNEKNSVDTAKGLEEGAKNVVEIDLSAITGSADGKLIHGTGNASTPDRLQDSVFGINLNAIHLNRVVQMYQWEEESKSETKEKLGGGTETITTYTYQETWSTNLINSRDFKDPNARTKYANPTRFPYESLSQSAKSVKVGAYPISSGLISQIRAEQNINYLDKSQVNLPGSISQRAKVSEKEIYIGDPSNPKIGDLKITHQVAIPGEVSILGLYKSGVVGPYRTERNTVIERLQSGSHTAAEMFAAAEAENRIITWVVRLIGLLLFFFGFNMVLKPISTLGAVVPIFGNLLGWGISLVSGIVAFILTVLTVGMAWIFYRPILGIALLIVAGGLVYFLYQKKKEVTAPSGSTPGYPLNPKQG